MCDSVPADVLRLIALYAHVMPKHSYNVRLDEYQLNHGTPAASSRAIAAHFSAQGAEMSPTFVLSTLRRWRRCGDPTQLRTSGCTARRAHEAERRWMKAKLKEQSDLYIL
jgi:hypothetical protein